ncbi:hypothetical protein PF008_g27628 [Phytophthora fragariae]|uniref:Uncharacterized protein n=1 Tax=Phytophthora fragariae TaxID=53985 RepID=A0A6G0QDN3_9STRA|nr:hypothetical protein PF008_g27628 [Phytophthora fragariae]
MSSPKTIEIGRRLAIQALECLQICFRGAYSIFNACRSRSGIVPLLDQAIGGRSNSARAGFELRHPHLSLLQSLGGSGQAGLRQEELMFGVFTRPIQIVPILLKLLNLVTGQPHLFCQVIALILENISLGGYLVESRLEVAKIRLVLPELRLELDDHRIGNFVRIAWLLE